MRSWITAAVALSIALALSAAESPFFRLDRTTSNGKTTVTGKNISNAAIVAYVVVAESNSKRAVWHGVYTGSDNLPAGKSITIDVSVIPSSEQAAISVDYVRLADGTSWGPVQTDDAKEIAARFQK